MSNIVIYKIICNNSDITNIYIGRTSNFKRRKNVHKSRCNDENNKCYNLKIYRIIREHGGFDNWSMIIIDNCIIWFHSDFNYNQRLY
jgi:hypothetical protein